MPGNIGIKAKVDIERVTKEFREKLYGEIERAYQEAKEKQKEEPKDTNSQEKSNDKEEKKDEQAIGSGESLPFR